MMDKITPCLWFDDKAEEAANFYVTLLPHSRIDEVTRAPVYYPGGSEGAVITVAFTLAGRSFLALNGGPYFTFTEAVSLSIDCEDQAEVDRLWETLISNGGAPSQCGWLKDRYGLSWQIIPKLLPRLLADPDRAAASRTMKAMMEMVKIDTQVLQRAFDGA
jgi:predicted 3-demethylubiquinone-9 3-methyltransferase (glyoxalase superfamily)